MACRVRPGISREQRQLMLRLRRPKVRNIPYDGECAVLNQLNWRPWLSPSKTHNEDKETTCRKIVIS
jgi:hypothetical protein